jgi:VCBS repeat-containing protein
LSVDPDVVNNLSTTGKILWAFDSGSEAFDHLAAGEQLTLTYVITATDSQGAATTQTVAITITGTNDAPSISLQTGDDDAAEIDADGGTLATAGTFTVSDADRSDVVSGEVVGVTKSGNLVGLTASDSQLAAMLSIDSSVIDAASTSGVITWQFDSSGETFGYLGEGETLELVYTIRVTDSDGATADREVTITIIGRNSAPEITTDAGDSDAVTLTETDSTITSAGTLTATDINTTDIVSAEVTGVSVGGVTGGLVSATAELLAMLSVDPDVIGDTETTGKIQWAFDSGAEAFDHLAAGESLTLVYTLNVTDSSGASDTKEVTITIHGTNDAPVAIPDEMTTPKNLGVRTGTLAANDPDASDTLTYSLAVAPSSGTVTVDPDGVYRFDPGTDFHDLALGETRVVSFVFEASDPHGLSAQQTVTITVIGTNDAPVITVDENDSAAVSITAARGSLTETGSLSVSDNNRSDVVTASVTGVSLGGHVAGFNTNSQRVIAMFSTSNQVIDAASQTGTLVWSFDSGDEHFRHLATGESMEIRYTITVVDSHGLSAVRQVVVTVLGNNVAPVATGETVFMAPGLGMVIEDAAPLANDIDTDGDSIQFRVVTPPRFGSLSTDASGRLVYTPLPGFTGTDTIAYRVTDGYLDSEVVVLTIEVGGNDAGGDFALPGRIEPETDDAEDLDSEDAEEDSADDESLDDGESEVKETESEDGEAVQQQTAMVIPYRYDTLQLGQSDDAESALLDRQFKARTNQMVGLTSASEALREELLRSVSIDTIGDSSDWSLTVALGDAIMTTANATFSAATAGTLFWGLRGAALITTLASSFPALANLDPANLLGDYRAAKNRFKQSDVLETMISGKK